MSHSPANTRPLALVTGSSRGIGLGIALALAGRGFDIALNAPPGESLEEAIERVSALGVGVTGVQADIADLDGHEQLLDQCEARLGSLSTLVNNAGVGVLSRGDILDATVESFDRCIGINTRAPFFLSQAFARRLLTRPRDDGRFYSIVNITSSNASAVAVTRGEYAVSKAAAAMMSQAFAVRLGREHVAVYDVQPGVIETDMTAPVMGRYRERIDAGLTLIPEVGSVEDIGRITATLASGDLPYTTGQVIAADAGMLVPRF